MNRLLEWLAVFGLLAATASAQVILAHRRPAANITICYPLQDNMSDYTNGLPVNLDGLNGGCPLTGVPAWAGAYVAGTYSNVAPQLWYVDAYTTDSTGSLTNADGTNDFGAQFLGGTQYVWSVTSTLVTITTNAWTISSNVVKAWPDLRPKLWYVDAMSEYTNTTDLTPTNVVGGTNWVFQLVNWDDWSSTNQQQWTNVYAAKGY